ncbi:YueI family protein [Mesobacillus jeotgali]|uniref:YueI family protein n=1 Tax=Mesobacillus jeotgali TaxID=129985 RepID=UPI0027D47524|nr:YueI family protein [Mesobacillus jeotgali]
MTKLSNSKLDDYLQQGIHGAKQTKPDERRRFLTTLRERVIIALSQGEVMRKGVEPEVEQLMDENREAHLFLNGNIAYTHLSEYIKAAEKRGIEFTIVTNKEYDSELGLVLAHDHAIDKEEIYLSKKVRPVVQTSPKVKKKGFFSKLFGR